VRVHARSALFDLYGDHLRAREDRAPVAALVRLLSSLDIAAPAVRTAISRMVRQGWLEPVRLDQGPGYRITEQARVRLDDAAARIYRTREHRWDGSWDLLVVTPPPVRSARERVRSGLGFLGYAPLSDSTWISAVRSPEVEPLLAAEGAALARFDAHDADPADRAAQAWDLKSLADAYRDWLAFAVDLVERPERHLGAAVAAASGSDERAFAVRSLLVHEWRKFLFTDPALPAELLPDGWPGEEAARYFGDQAARLLPAAVRFVDECLETPATPAPQSDPLSDPEAPGGSLR
jgi:phenylacetic acid degradation operon negative regulatory protein